MRKILISYMVVMLLTSANPLFSNVSLAAPVDDTPTQTKVKKALEQYQKAQKQVQALQKKISATDRNMNNTFQKLEQVKDKQAQTQKRFDQILVRIYTSGFHSMEAQLLGSQSFSEFLYRLEFIRLVMQRDHKVVNQYKQEKEQIIHHQATIDKQVSSLQPLLQEAEKKNKQLQKQYQSLSTDLKKERTQSTSTKKNSKTQELKPLPDQSWLNKARAMIGTVKYKFGAENHPYFDCSGWIQYVFLKYRGIKLPRTSSAQASVGTPVSKENLQPGDLVFFQGTYKSGISHVGIYLGNGNFISNKNEKLDLQIDSLNRSYTKSHYWGAKRVN